MPTDVIESDTVPTRHFARLVLASLLLLVPLCGRTLPQDRGYFQFVRDSWGTEEGIPQVTVHAIAQDRDGYIWVATDSGLGRLDGMRFERFLRDKYPVLGTNSMLALHLDRSGRLWIGTGRGAVFYERGEFQAVHGPGGELGEVDAIVEDEEGNLYLAGQHVFRRRLGANEVTPIAGVDAKVRSLTLHAGEVWAASANAMFHIGRRDEALPVPIENRDATRTINRIVSLDAERVLLAADDGLHIWRGGALKRIELVDPRNPPRPLSGNSYAAAWIDDSGSIWAGSHEALLRLDADAKLVDIVYSESAEGVNDPISFFEDRERNLWIGSRTRGVTRLWAGRAQLFGTADGLREAVVWSMLPMPDHTMLVGTFRGIYRFDGHRMSLMVQPEALASGDAYSLQRGPDGNIWVGGEHGLTEIELKPELSTRRFDALAQAKVANIEFDPDGSMWLATSQGLFLRRNGQIQRMGEEAGIEFVFGLRRDSRGTLWVGTRKGLFSLVEGRFERYPEGALQKALITTISETDQGEILVGSHEDGFFVLDARKPAYPLRRHVALNSFPITGLVTSRDGYLWITSLQGVLRVRLDQLDRLPEHAETSYVVSDLGDKPGSQRARCCNGVSNAHALIADDSLFVATSQGLLKIPLDQAVTNPVPPLVHVQSIRNHAQTRAVGGQALVLDGADRDLEINYTALSFQDPRNIKFQYRMLGLSDAWVDAGQRRTAYFTNLSGGSYRFQLKAANSAGTWSDLSDEAAVTVPLLWHEKTSVRGLLVLSGLCALGGVYWVALRQYRRRGRTLEGIVAHRTAELQDANTQLELGQHDLSVLGEVGREITATLDQEAVFRTLDRHVHALLDAPSFAIYLIDADGNTLDSALFVEQGQPRAVDRVDLGNSTRACAQCVRERREILVDIPPEAQDEVEVPGTLRTLSRLFAPLAIGERVFGLMTIQSPRRQAYAERERMIFRTLCAYGAIALDNAAAYQRLAETDAALQRTLREQQVIFEYTSGAIQFTRGRTIVRCNRGMEELLGYGPGELTGQPTRVFYDSDEAWEAFGRRNYPLLAGGDVAQGETEFLRRDGSRSHVLFSGKAIDPHDVSQGVVWVAQDITERRRHEQLLFEGKQQVEHALRQMERSQRQVSLLSELTGFMQACPTADDAYSCIAGYGPRLFPGSLGALYLFDEADSELVEKVCWGDETDRSGRESSFGAAECWALRRGQPYRIDQPTGVLCCKHVAAMGGERKPYACVPVGAQGKTFGLLFVEHRQLVAGVPLDVPQGLAVAMAEQTSLALANIHLREALVRARPAD